MKMGPKPFDQDVTNSMHFKPDFITGTIREEAMLSGPNVLMHTLLSVHILNDVLAEAGLPTHDFPSMLFQH